MAGDVQSNPARQMAISDTWPASVIVGTACNIAHVMWYTCPSCRGVLEHRVQVLQSIAAARSRRRYCSSCFLLRKAPIEAERSWPSRIQLKERKMADLDGSYVWVINDMQMPVVGAITGLASDPIEDVLSLTAVHRRSSTRRGRQARFLIGDDCFLNPFSRQVRSATHQCFPGEPPSLL